MDKLNLVTELDYLFSSIFDKIVMGNASDDERKFASDNDDMASNCVLWLSGDKLFTDQDQEDVMELWVTAKELQLL